jgi:uncharacterized protein YggU (UPF0235/DUF167 family)
MARRNDEVLRARIRVRIAPRASRDALGAMLGDERVAPPVDGQANEAVVRLLAKRLKVGRAAVTIVRGLRSRQKLVEVRGLTEEQLRARL